MLCACLVVRMCSWFGWAPWAWCAPAPFSAAGRTGYKEVAPPIWFPGFDTDALCCAAMDGPGKVGCLSFRRCVSVTFSDENGSGEDASSPDRQMALRSHSAFYPKRFKAGGRNASRRNTMAGIPIRQLTVGRWLSPSFLGRPPLTKDCRPHPSPSHVHGTPSLSGTSRLGPSLGGRGQGFRAGQRPDPQKGPRQEPGTAAHQPAAAPEPRNRPPPGVHTTPNAHTPRATRSRRRPDWRSRAGGLQCLLSGSVVPEERCPPLSHTPRRKPQKGRGGEGRGQYYYRGPPPTRSLPFPSLSSPILNIVILDFFRGHSFFLLPFLIPVFLFFPSF